MPPKRKLGEEQQDDTYPARSGGPGPSPATGPKKRKSTTNADISDSSTPAESSTIAKPKSTRKPATPRHKNASQRKQKVSANEEEQASSQTTPATKTKAGKGKKINAVSEEFVNGTDEDEESDAEDQNAEDAEDAEDVQGGSSEKLKAKARKGKLTKGKSAKGKSGKAKATQKAPKKKEAVTLERAVSKNKPTKPGSVSDLNTFINLDKDEPGVAAYLGYKTMPSFRVFMCSAIVMDTYDEMVTMKLPQPAKRDVLGLLQDADMDTLFPSNTRKEDRYPLNVAEKEELRSNQLHSWAWLLVDMNRRISSTDESTYPMTTFLPFSSTIQSLVVPKIEQTLMQVPRLGPVGTDETGLEVWNRLANLLRFAKYIYGSPTQRDRFTKRNSFAARRIAESSLPLWMRDKVDIQVQSTDHLFQPSLPPKDFKLVMQLSSKDEKCVAAKKHLEETEAEVTSSQTSLGDPRVLSAPQFRDSIRRQYGFRNLGLQLFSVSAEAPGVDEETEMIKVWPNGLPWAEIQAMAAERQTITFKFRVELLDENDLFEDDGPPPALRDLLRIENNDVVDKVALPDIEKAVTGEFDPAGEVFGFARSANQANCVPQLEPGEDEAAFLKRHDGFDVRTEEGLLAWQNAVFDFIAPSQPMPRFPDEKIGKDIKEALKEARNEGQQAAMMDFTQDPDGKDLAATVSGIDHDRIQSAYSGTDAQLGPRLDLCIIALQLELVPKKSPSDTQMYKCPLISTDRIFYPWQVTGAVWMLGRALGEVPMDPREYKTDDPEKNGKIQAALQLLRVLAVRGGIVADQTGLGKTIQTLLFLALFIKYREFATKSKTDGIYRPTSILVPSGVVKQWAEEIQKHWANDMKLIVNYSSQSSMGKGKLIMKASHCKLFPLKPQKRLPTRLRAAFDQTNPVASQYVVLSSIQTNTVRNVTEVQRKIKAVPYHPPRFEGTGKHKTEIFQKEAQKIWFYKHRMEGVFAMQIVDEAHRMKNSSTRTHFSVLGAKSVFTFLLTATPMLNNHADILGLLKLLWPVVEQLLEKCPQEVQDFAVENPGLDLYEKIADIGPDPSARQLWALDPSRVGALLKSNDTTIVACHYHHIDDLITLRRSAASKLPLDDKGNVLELKGLMKPYSVKTVNLEYRPHEKFEMQWLHRDSARKFYLCIKGGSSSQDDTQVEAGISQPPGPADKKPFAYPVGPIKDMAITTASVLLGRFNKIMTAAGRNSLAENITEWRNSRLDGDWFIKCVWREGDPPVRYREEKLAYLCWGAPGVKYVLAHLARKILGTKEKLLLGEAHLLPAWFYEIVLRYAYVDARVLNADLSTKERQTLVSEFNDANSSLKVLIVLYDVSCDGLNLHKACHQAIIMTAARNIFLEIQLWGRIIRVVQTKSPQITRKFTLQSNDSYRESKQVDKAVLEVATRCNDPAIRALLVDLLNEAQPELLKVQGFVLSQEAMDLAEDAKAPVDALSSVQKIKKLDKAKRDPSETSLAEAPLVKEEKAKIISNIEEEDLPSGDDTDDDDFMKASDSDSSNLSSDDDTTRSDSGSEFDTDEDDESSEEEDEEESEGEDEGEDDDNDFDVKVPHTSDEMMSFSAAELENIDQEALCLERLMRLDAMKVYVDEDLKDAEVLSRAIHLLHCARFGKDASPFAISCHIKYDQLNDKVERTIKEKYKDSENHVTALRKLYDMRKNRT